MNKEARQPPTSVRLQQEVREWLVQRAKKGDRSMNAEINRILKQVMGGEAAREQ
ncbi:Arc family DNA-binding protein [Thiothrix winogradskyi]|uniref:Arc family DNA-binding protein n=1 Tax=Thiothrix winogradskyi TaxID=96472 RepID=A0ABY3T484_9GAMM|nr:Arc family DNA-binding protein [Thiothrix winogradskyi]UJS26238.1 Arc family DNA-binding protein [Thiothrix winogradskyi]